MFESDLELLLPATYVESVSERIQLYRRLDWLKTEEQLTAFEAELKDRFGELPHVAKELIQVVRLRHIGMRSGIEKITLRKGKLTAYLLSNFDSKFYQSDIFNKMLMYAVEHPRATLFKEENGKRTLTLLNISNVQQAYDCFVQMQ